MEIYDTAEYGLSLVNWENLTEENLARSVCSDVSPCPLVFRYKIAPFLWIWWRGGSTSHMRVLWPTLRVVQQIYHAYAISQISSAWTIRYGKVQYFGGNVSWTLSKLWDTFQGHMVLYLGCVPFPVSFWMPLTVLTVVRRSTLPSPIRSFSQ